MKAITKPPLGIMPEWYWRELRVKHLRAAIRRYRYYYRHHHPEKILSDEWPNEIRNHLKWLSNRKRAL